MLNRIFMAAAASLITVGAAYADGHVAAGEKLVAKRCKACHMIADGDNVILKGGKTGPNLFGVVGRTAGTYDGFKYGDDTIAAGEQGLVWNEEEISTYLKDPRKYLRAYLSNKKAKSKMSFKLRKEDDRTAVSAYLASLN
jgi:cytochrome c